MKKLFNIKMLMEKNIIVKFMAIVGMLVCGIISCDQMTDNYQKYLEGGEIIYPGKADSIKTFPGKYRIELQWMIMSDQSVHSAIVYWNNKQHSKNVSITRTSGIDIVNVLLNDMEEQTYTFEVYTFDKAGNQSVKSEAIGTVFGDKYRSTLLNRAIRSYEYNEESGLTFLWETADAGTLSEEIVYTNLNGQDRSLILPAEQETVALEDYNPDLGFQYLTVYTPDSMAIDTFKTALTQIVLGFEKTEKEINKSLFSLAVFPGDYSTPNASASTVDKIWTNENAINNGTSYISLVDGHVIPQWFTIDLGNTYELTRMKLFQRGDNGGGANRLYAGGNLKEFEVWGSLDPDFSYNPDDHDGNFGGDWVLLQSCVVNRPSGNVIANDATRTDNTAEDIEAAMSGHDYSFSYTGNIRYVRIKTIANWDAAGRAFTNIASIALWGMQY